MRVTITSVLALCLTTFIASTTAESTHFVSQNAAARAAVAARDLSALQARDHHAHAHRRSLTLANGRKFRVRRSTAAQREAQGKLNAYAENQAAINTKWQAAAIESLKKGEKPQTFDEFAGQNSDSSDDGGDDSSEESTESDDDDDKSEATPTPKAKPAPEKAQSTKQPTDWKSQEPKTQKPKKQEEQKPKADAPTSNTETQSHTSSSATSSAQGAHASSQSSSSGSASSSSGKQFSGDGTYYATGLGACGWTNKDSDYIVAVSQDLYNTFGLSNDSKVCGRKITAHRGGKSVTVTVSDACPGCAWGSLDFSPAAFKALGTEEEGRIPITWTWA